MSTTAEQIRKLEWELLSLKHKSLLEGYQSRIEKIWNEIHKCLEYIDTRGTNVGNPDPGLPNDMLVNQAKQYMEKLRTELNELVLRIPNNTDPIDWSVN